MAPREKRGLQADELHLRQPLEALMGNREAEIRDVGYGRLTTTHSGSHSVSGNPRVGIDR